MLVKSFYDRHPYRIKLFRICNPENTELGICNPLRMADCGSKHTDYKSSFFQVGVANPDKQELIAPIHSF